MKQLLLQIMFITIITCFQPLQSPAADKVFEPSDVILYNQMDEFEARSPTAEVIASFIGQLTDKAATLWTGQKSTTGKSGLLAVAIRPDRTMKIWVDLENTFQPSLTASLETKMKDVGVPPVKGGPIAFAVRFNLWGGSTNKQNAGEKIPLPQSWTEAAKKQSKSLKIPDGLLPFVWKEEHAGTSDTNKPKFFVPAGFVLQELSPTGGKILRPNGWFYTEEHREHVFMWTIAKENPDKGNYDTGVRIQCFVGVKEGTGKSPQEFVQAFVDEKKKTVKVVRQCPKQVQDLFTRIGIETEETLMVDAKPRPYHILYSCFWGNNVDIVVISIAGTTPDLWPKYTSTFDSMSNFELIDMAKFEKNATPTQPAGAKPKSPK